MSTVSYVVETFKKMYEDPACENVTYEKMQELLNKGNITQEEFDYIVGRLNEQ